MTQKILYVQYTNPAHYPSLEHSSHIFAQRNWQVLFVGVKGWGKAVVGLSGRPHVEVKLIPFCGPGFAQKCHYFGFCLWVLLWALRWKPQWIYASDPLACLPTVLTPFFCRSRLVYHEQDYPDPQAARSLFFRMVLWARKELARRAFVCILPNAQRMKRFGLEMGVTEKVICVWNCPSLEELPPALPTSKTREPFRLLYHGTLVPSRLPMTLLHALVLLPESVRLRVIGYETIGHPNYMQRFQEEAAGLGVFHRLEWKGTVANRKELFAQSLDCDLGVAFVPLSSGDFNEEAMVGASNKPFDYLACGLALLVSDRPEWKKIYVDSGMGLTCNPQNPQSIAEAVQWFLEHPQEGQAMGAKGRKQILESWNYEETFRPVLERMKEG